MLVQVGRSSLLIKCRSLHLPGEVVWQAGGGGGGVRGSPPTPPAVPASSKWADPGTCWPMNKGPRSVQNRGPWSGQSEADQEEPRPPGGEADLPMCKGSGGGAPSKIPMRVMDNPNMFEINKS